jgi:hypothetical protein
MATVAISITNPVKMVDGKPTPDTSNHGLSVKLHNAFCIEMVDYHGPPQQGSTGLTIPARIASKAKVLTGIGSSTTGTMGSIFADPNKSIFTSTDTEVPTTKSNESKSYM